MLPRYGRLGASSRVRMYQYVPSLRSAGMQVSVSPLFDDSYIHASYNGGHSLGSILRGYGRRIATLLGKGRPDLIWIEKELLPWVPAAIERLVRSKTAVIVDYDDAVFHRYDHHDFAIVRRMLGGKVDAVMRDADMVTAGNAYLADRATMAGCRDVRQLPTVVDLNRYGAAPVRGEGAVVVGWIGSPATADYLQMLAPVLHRLSRERRIRCVAVGARDDQLRGTPFRAMAWSETEEASQVASFDIGLMPLPDAAWERGKCGYKLIQYMASSLPVVASPVGVNMEIVTNGENGYLAGTDGEWLSALRSLVDDASLRAQMGAAGRRRVSDWYSLQAQSPRLIEMFASVASRRTR